MTTRFVAWAHVLSACVSFATVSASAAPFAYITNFNSSNVSVVDTATNTVVASIPTLGGGHGVAVNTSGTRVYVAHTTANLVSVIDAKRNVVVAEIPAGAEPVGVAVNPEGTRVFVTNRDNLFTVDTATNTLGRALHVGAAPFGLAVNPAGTRLYVAASGAHHVSIVDVVNNAIVGTIPTGSNSAPLAVALNRDGSRLYIATRDAGTVIVVDTSDHSIVKSIAAGTAMNAVTVAPDGTRVWASDGAGRVAVIDTATNVLLTPIQIGGRPTGIGVNDAGTRVYVAGAPGDAIAVIDAARDVVVATIAVGSVPVAFGHFFTPTPSIAVEYFHTGFDHYFVTAIAAEIQGLDSGAFAGWARTGQNFGVLSAGTAGVSDVCRFFSDSFAPKSSHFYTPFPDECATVRQNAAWSFEGLVYSVGLPDMSGSCPAGMNPLYRVYNNGLSGAPNHRYTTSLQIRSAMLSQGWIAEGAGALGVIGCVVV